MKEPADLHAPEKIAIIGIGCRLPGGVNDHRAFWRNLVEGADLLADTPLDRYDVGTLGTRHKSKPGRLVGRRGGYIDGFDEFDPAFFGISPREAAHMDPQQRKLLEVVWEALEDGGQRPLELAGRDVGVFIGAFTLDYKILQFSDLSFETLAAHTATGTMMTMVSNRISYCFDFRGPSLSIDTACSSSLVAVHLACQSLRRGESCLAVAGGVLLHCAPQYTIAESKGGFLSPDGRSRTFDARANGYVRAEGVASVVLKRLGDALRDGDPIHAVIAASGTNQDGRTNGITVPSADAQLDLIRSVCAQAGIVPGALQYVEAHGTSTPVGDPIEAQALGRALAIGRQPGARCYIGSVKANLGHTEAAAGVVGLIKAALSLAHRRIPPQINLDRINPQIDLAQMPYEIAARALDWPEHEGPARAGVNSFGFGGSNAHVILEEAPVRAWPAAQRAAGPAGGYRILPLSARDPAALPELAHRLRAELAGAHGPAPALEDVAFTLARHRERLEHRLCVVYANQTELEARLDAVAAGCSDPAAQVGAAREPARRRVAWVFTGMGPQWWGMGRELFEREPLYRAALERCDREIAKRTGWSLLAELHKDEASSQMGETWLAQPANFALQLGLAELWRSYGLEPDAVVGHSAGEVAAFYVAGVYSFEDAVQVIVERSRLQQRLAGSGTMLAVGLSEAQARARLAPWLEGVSIAAINAPSALTLAGEPAPLEQIASALREQGVFARFLKVAVPYHSAQMEPIRAELLAGLAELAPREARVPLYVTAGGVRARGPELDAGYWWRNVRDTVRFLDASELLLDAGFELFLELGPHPVLASALGECFEARGLQGLALPSLRRQEGESLRMATTLAALHSAGVELDWSRMHPGGRPVPLPSYPWRRERYWVEPGPVERVRLGKTDHPLLGRRIASAEPTWEVQLDTEAHPYLADHGIQGSAVFPAAGYVEMAAQAARALTGGRSVELADLEFHKALFLSETEPRSLQLALAFDRGSFTIAEASGSQPQERVVYACGSVRPAQSRGLAPALDTAAVQARAARVLDAGSCYAELARLGYQYGAAFQGIERVWIGPAEALARIVPPAALAASKPDHFHPALLDACFQTLLAPLLLERPEDSRSTDIRLPVAIEELRSLPAALGELWAHARITREDADEIAGDIAVYDAAGAPLAAVRGLRAASTEAAVGRLGLATIDRWLFDLAWVEREPLAEETQSALDAPPLCAAAPAAADAGWLVLGDGGGLGAQLAALLEARGERCCRVVACAGELELRGDGRAASVDPHSSAQFEQLLRALAGGGPRRWRGIVHLWNLEAPELEDLELSALQRASRRGCYSLVALARALQQSEAHAPLFVLTRGAHAVAAGDAVRPLAAPAWGVVRVLWYQELPASRGKLIDLDPAAPESSQSLRAQAEQLLREFASADEDEIALRGERRWSSRLRPAAQLIRPLTPLLRADACYLVSGAFGALGRLLCRRLIKRGARRLILMGRSPLAERAQDVDPDSAAGRNLRFVRELEQLGAQVIHACVDVADAVALERWLAEFRSRELPPIRGVFHSAGQVRDTLLEQMDPETFEAVLAPKLYGSYLLHHLLADEPLEHFVLFSSIASLITTAGQTNYAAANAFLDALAHHRRARGLPALSVNWGPWATGMIRELGLVEHYRKNRGMSCLAPEAGMDVLERVLGDERAQLVVSTVVDWPAFLAWYPTRPRLIEEIAQQGESAACAGGSFLEALRSTAAQARSALVSARFAALASEVLRVPLEQLGPQVSLSALGLDSLLALELRARVSKELGVALPVVTLLSGQGMDALAADLQQRLLTLLEQESGTSEDVQFELASDEHIYPLTENQKALWFLKQLHPDGFAYNIGGAVEVQHAFEPERMFEAVRFLVARHPSLRANFGLQDGRPVQRIAAHVEADVALIDVQGEHPEVVRDLMIREYRRPYDLERDRLMRFRMYRLAADRFILMKAVHHIISDAISTFTFIEELLAVYAQLCRGERPALPPPAARYLDFFNHQQRFLASPAAASMLEYWKRQLPAELPLLSLPTDRPRPMVQGANGASQFFQLDRELTERIHALSHETGATVFTILLGAYYVLLQRYSGQDSIIVGSPVTGRTQQEFSALYGYFVNPLPLHADLSGDPSFIDFLEQVRQTVLGGLDNQEYPFVRLVEQLQLQHDPGRSAVFQAMFILLAHKVATEQYGYRLEYIELPEEEGQFDLTLSAYEDTLERSFHCVLKYNSDLFLPSTVQRMAEHYVNLLTSLTREPKRSLCEHELLGSRERALILERWSQCQTRLAVDAPVHRLIAAAAAERPDAVAVCAIAAGAQPQRLSYGELERRSNQFARQLLRHGVRRGDTVALCLDKSVELIMAVLGVLKAGCAYLPLATDCPVDRLSYMLARADARLLLVEDAGDPALEGALQCRTLALRAALQAAAELDASPLQLESAQSDPAYVIFTSGSTGQPKGVRVSQRSLACAYRAWEHEYRLRTDVRVHLQLASFAFDVFTGDFARALCSGGTLVLIPKDVALRPERLYAIMRSEQVDCGEFVPAVARGLLAYCTREGLRLDFMRLLVVGSDVWKIEEHRALRGLCGPQTRLVNSYGLTEATVDSTFFEGTADELEPGRMTPIGRPFAGSRVYVLDALGRPLSAGLPGELWIGGEGVAEGYLGDERQTEQRFVTRRLGGELQRLYRTGDLGHWDADGVLHLLGRLDGQVKLRGHRIEVAEIESRLAALPEVDRAVVVVRTDARGEQVLCAYCVPVPGARLRPRSLREHLAAQLPTFMIPGLFAELAELPLTANGKVDTASLPLPEPSRELEALEAPRTLYEQRTAELWQRLLGLSAVGLQQDFFELGGNSIRLMELVYQLEAEFGINLAVSQLFKTSTLLGMARTVEDIVLGRAAGSQSFLRFNPGAQSSIYCFPPAGGHGLVYHRLSAHLPQLSLVAFNYQVGADRVERHADEIESLQPAGALALLGYSLGGNLAFEVARELERRGRQVTQVLILDSYRILESFPFTDSHLEEFAEELRGQLRKHTGSDQLEQRLLVQAKEYIVFCSQRRNEGTIRAPLSVLSDAGKYELYAADQPGSWHGASSSGAALYRGHGPHADMLSEEFAERNAALIREILAGARAPDRAEQGSRS